MQHWVFHPHQEAKIVSTAEYNVLLKEGWFDSPDKFNQKPVVHEPVKVEESKPIENEINDPVLEEPIAEEPAPAKKKPGRPPRLASNDGVA